MSQNNGQTNLREIAAKVRELIMIFAALIVAII